MTSLHFRQQGGASARRLKSALRRLGQACLMALAPFAAHAATYRIVDLGVADGLISSAAGINNSGQITGITCSYNTQTFHNCKVFFTDANGSGLRTLLTIGDYNGLWINTNGQVFGNSDSGPFFTGANGVGKTSISSVQTIAGANDSGQVIAGSYLSGPNATGLTDFSSTLPGNGPLSASALNNQGRVVGGSFTSNSQIPFFTNAGATSAVQLTALGSNSIATAINASGQIIGLINNSSVRSGYVTGANGSGVTLLGTASVSRFPNAINSNGQVVGDSWLYSGGTYTELNDIPAVQAAGWSLLHPTAINDSGQIVGTGTIGGVQHAFLLTPQTGTLASNTTLVVNPNPAVVSQQVTLHATVAGAAPTGTVQFKDGGTNLSSAVTLTNGVATLKTSSLSKSTHSITANYSGDSSNSTSASNTVSIAINAAVAANVVLESNAGSQIATEFKSPVTLTAKVTGVSPTGTVQFKLNGTNFGSPVTISNGVATLVTSDLPLGTDTLIASYLGDTINLPNNSNSVAVLISLGESDSDAPTLPQWGIIIAVALISLTLLSAQRAR